MGLMISPIVLPPGLPNAGKSSVLNAVLGRSAVSVSRTPGRTRYFQTHFLTPTVRLCDCPGLVFPSTAPRELQVGPQPPNSPLVSTNTAFIASFCPHPPLPRSWQGCTPFPSCRSRTQPWASWPPAFPFPPCWPCGLPAARWVGRRGTSAKVKTLYFGFPSPRIGVSFVSFTLPDLSIPPFTPSLVAAWAEKRGYRTARAARHDVYRAANSILRMAADGRLLLCLRPPGYSANASECAAPSCVT